MTFTKTAFGVTTTTTCQDGIEMLKACGGDFTVEKQQVSYPITKTVPVGIDDTITQTEWMPVDAYVPVRTDTMANIADTTVGDGYTVLQNRETIDLVNAICKDHDLTYKYMTLLGGGRGLCMQIECPDLNEALSIGNDLNSGLLTVSNFHDGSGSLKVHVSLLRLFCLNVMPALSREHRATKKNGGMAHTVRHSSRMETRLNDLVKVYRESMGDAIETADTLRLLGNKKCSETEWQELYKRVLLADGKDDSELSKCAETQFANKLATVKMLAKAPENQPVDSALEGTFFHAIQALTAYSTRGIATRQTSSGVSDAEKRFTSAYFGAGAALATRTLQVACELAGV